MVGRAMAGLIMPGARTIAIGIAAIIMAGTVTRSRRIRASPAKPARSGASNKFGSDELQTDKLMERRKRAALFVESKAFGHAVVALQHVEQRRHFGERNHVRPVGKSLVRPVMGFDEQAGDADRHGGAGQHRHEFALAAR